MTLNTVADPRFPRGSANISFDKNFAENCMKMKTIGPKVIECSPPWVRQKKHVLTPSDRYTYAQLLLGVVMIKTNYVDSLHFVDQCPLMRLTKLSSDWSIHTAIESVQTADSCLEYHQIICQRKQLNQGTLVPY